MTNETPCVVVQNVGGESYIIPKSEIIVLLLGEMSRLYSPMGTK